MKQCGVGLIVCMKECVQHLIDEQLPCYNDALNPIFRECLSVAAIAQDASWITLARQLLCRMPTHLRQEAEFNLQMVCPLDSSYWDIYMCLCTTDHVPESKYY